MENYGGGGDTLNEIIKDEVIKRETVEKEMLKKKCKVYLNVKKVI